MEGFQPKKRVKRCALSLNEKIIVLNVYDALRHMYPSKSVDDVVELCCTMTGVSKTTIYTNLKHRKCGDIREPQLDHGRKKLTVDESTKNFIRRTVHSFYLKKEIPTLDKIWHVLNEDQNFAPISRNKLFKTMHELHFSWKKVGRNSVLIDKDEIVCWRRNYLRSVRKYRSEGRQIYYLDETWLNEGHAVTKAWVDNTVTSCRQAFIEGLSTGYKPPPGKGRRLIITHIGSENGFVAGGLLEFQSKKTGDYHEDMNSDVFEEYFHQMIDLIPQGSIIVMDNASYHSRLSEKLPTNAWRKQNIIEWLTSKNITFPKDAIKIELMAVARENKRRYKRYVIDDMAANKGITVLRLPPYHCELNPIELVWAQVKGEVARQNTSFKLENVRKLLTDSLQNVTPAKWKNCVQHVIHVEEKMWVLDNLVEETVPSVIISVDMNDSDTDDPWSDIDID